MLHKLDELFYQTHLRLVKLMLNSYDDSKTKKHQNCDKHVVIIPCCDSVLYTSRNSYFPLV